MAAWRSFVPRDAAAAATAVDAKAVPPIWGQLSNAWGSDQRRIAVLVSMHDATRLRRMLANAESKTSAVVEKPFSPAEDRAESAANDFGEDLRQHWSGVTASLHDAIAEVEQRKASAQSPEFSLADLEQARKARQEEERLAKERHKKDKLSHEQALARQSEFERKRPAVITSLLRVIDSDDGAEKIRQGVGSSQDAGLGCELLKQILDAKLPVSRKIVRPEVIIAAAECAGPPSDELVEVAMELGDMHTRGVAWADDATQGALQLVAAKFATPEGERCRSSRHMPPLLPTACMSGNVALVNCLLDIYDAEADRDAVSARLKSIKDSDGGTAMHRLMQMMSGKDQLVPLAQRLSQYLSMKDANRKGKTPLDIVRSCQGPDIASQIEALIK